MAVANCSVVGSSEITLKGARLTLKEKPTSRSGCRSGVEGFLETNSPLSVYVIGMLSLN